MRLATERQPDGAWLVTRVGGIGRLTGATMEQIMRMREATADERVEAAIAARRGIPMAPGGRLVVDLDDDGVAHLASPPRAHFVPGAPAVEVAR